MSSRSCSQLFATTKTRRDFSFSLSQCRKLSFCRQQQSCSRDDFLVPSTPPTSPHNADQKFPMTVLYLICNASKPRSRARIHSVTQLVNQRVSEREREQPFLLDRAHFSASTAAAASSSTCAGCCTRNCCALRGPPLCYFSRPTRVLSQFHRLILHTLVN